MLKTLSRYAAVALAMVALTFLTDCKKKPSDVADDVVPDTSGLPEGAALPPVKSIAAKLGFAAKLPADTEAYFSAINLAAHLDALKTSSWAKEVTAFLEDKTPAPSAAQGAMPDARAAMAQLWGRDFFLAVGKGGAKALAPWREVMSLQSELAALSTMQGYLPVTAAPAKDKTAEEVGQTLAMLLQNPELLKRCADIVTQLDLPPLMLGIQTDKPDEVIKQLVPDALMEQMKKKARVSQVTMRGDGRFTLVEGTLAALLTDELKGAWLAAMPGDLAAAKGPVIAILESIQKKPFAFAFGTTAGHVIIAVGSTRPNLDFVADPAKSLLSRPELAFVQPFATKNLISLDFAQGEVLQALEQTDSMQAAARGVLASLKANPTFAELAKAVEPKVQALAPLERDLYARKATTATAIAWWDKGLHIEMKGGQSPEGLKADTPLKFSPLLYDPSVVAGIAYHGDPEMTGRLRKLVEGWADVIHDAGMGLVKAGLGGKEGPEIAKWVESDVIPQVVDFYTGSKTLFQKGVGNEHAWVIDFAGKMPPLPFFPQKANETPPKMLRLASIDDVTNRAAIGTSWDQMQGSLGKIIGAFPLLGGQKLADPDIKNQNGGITTYSYPIMPDVDDLAPCASISSQLLMIGTSITQHGDLSTRLLKAKPATTANVAQWRINFPAMRDAVKTFSTGSAKPTNADQMKSTMKWLSPLGNATGRMWIEAGNVRNSITIEVKDVLHYD